MIIPTMCHGCSYGGYNCGILAHVEGGTFRRVEGNPYHPLNKGKLCAKGQSAVQWVYNLQRTKHPLARVGKKGNHKFERVSWDKALDMISENLMKIRERYGPEYIILSKGQASSWLGLHHQLFVRFLHALGSSNFSTWGPYVCYGPQLLYHRLTIGGPTYARPDYDNADLILEWFTGGGQGGPARRGVETLDTELRSVAVKVIDRVKKGAKLIVINPQLIPLAANGRAYRWLPVRPGTDGALALAMINVVINDELYDRTFVSTWCDGFSELREHIQQYTPEWAERITDIPAEDIRSVAVEYATTKRACIRISEAPQKRDLGCFARALPILMAISGHLDKPGGNVWFFPAARLGFDTFGDRLSDEMKARHLGGEKFYIRMRGGAVASFPSVVQALVSGEPYRPKALMIFGSDPMNTARNPSLISKALAELEFLVVVDVAPTPTARHADLILPAATRYECDGVPALWENHLALSNRIIEPLWESRNELQVVLELACRMGMGDGFWNGDYEAMVNAFLQPSGITLGELRDNSLEGLYLPRTEWMDERERYDKLFADLPNGRIQLYSTFLEGHGFGALPSYRGESEDPVNVADLAKEYPLLFTDEHSAYFNHHAWMRNVAWLREIGREPQAKIHPLTARRYGINHGDWVEIESQWGEMRAKAWLFPGIHPDTVMGQHGWWQGCEKLGIPEYSVLSGGTNVNALYNWEDRDEATENITKNALVRIRRSEPPSPVDPVEEVC